LAAALIPLHNSAVCSLGASCKKNKDRIAQNQFNKEEGKKSRTGNWKKREQTEQETKQSRTGQAPNNPNRREANRASANKKTEIVGPILIYNLTGRTDSAKFHIGLDSIRFDSSRSERSGGKASEPRTG
jgi:hypothetical protein